jgi:hypothetical protein
MGTFAETAIVDTVYRLPTRKTNFRFPFLFFVCSEQTEIALFRHFRFCIYMYIYAAVLIYVYIYIYGKRSYIYTVCIFVPFSPLKRQHLYTRLCSSVFRLNGLDGLNGLAHLCLYRTIMWPLTQIFVAVYDILHINCRAGVIHLN